MNLIRTSALNGIAVSVRTLTSLALNKLLAVYVGPSGYAIIGQFQNFVQVATVFGSNAINAGVTKYTAEYSDDVEAQHRVWRTAARISFYAAIALTLGIAAFHTMLARLLLKNDAYGSVFLWLAATVGMFIFNGLLLAILNGMKDIGRYVVINIAGSLFSLAVTYLLVHIWGIYGALLSLAVYPSLTFAVCYLLTLRARWFRLSYLLGPIDRKSALNLSKFVVMAVVSGISLPTAQVIIRTYLGQRFGWGTAGIWEGLGRLSAAYLLVFTTTLSVYYLPRFSEIQTREEMRHELISGYKVLAPVVVLCALLVYLFRDFLILLLFSNRFSAMRDLFAWQTAGDALKMLTWLPGYILLARAMTWEFVLVDLGSAAVYVGLAMLCIPVLGLRGAVVAYFLQYVFAIGLLASLLRWRKVL